MKKSESSPKKNTRKLKKNMYKTFLKSLNWSKKNSKNIDFIKNMKRNHFFFNICYLKFFARPKKDLVCLVLPFQEISLRPELSSPPRCRLQWGGEYREHYKRILVSNIIYIFLSEFLLLLLLIFFHVMLMKRLYPYKYSFRYTKYVLKRKIF